MRSHLTWEFSAIDDIPSEFIRRLKKCEEMGQIYLLALEFEKIDMPLFEGDPWLRRVSGVGDLQSGVFELRVL